MATICFCLLTLLTVWQDGECALQLSTYFGDHMVLQRAPQQAVLWGTADTEGDTVRVRVTGQAEVITKVSQGQWKLSLPAVPAGGPHEVKVTSRDGAVTLSDVLFGDVWLCSGQSNMGFTMSQVFNSSEEIERAAAFTDIRFTKVKRQEATTPQSSVQYDIPWTAPDSPSLPHFSAMCFLFGEYLQPLLSSPLGLVESSWGGTPIEAWSNPQAIKDCTTSLAKRAGDGAPSANSVLWNGMINPLLSATITGALWYQGEANVHRVEKYSCQIQAMVREWRAQFHKQSLQQTSSQFPFGYVQLAANADNKEVGTFPAERWAQTANYGYSPNPSLPNTFMAVAMDLPDFSSPYGTIHPRDKQDVAARLVLGARNVAYGDNTVPFQGPFPTGFTANDVQQTLSIEYDQRRAELEPRSRDGFEVCCTERDVTACDDAQDTWVAAPISTLETGLVTVSTSACGSGRLVGMRYEWRTSPCDVKECTLYDADSGLPAPPYITRSFNMSTSLHPL